MPRRAIIDVNRNLTLRGFVQEEDADLIVVRELDGQLHSMHKTRVLRIVHLVDPKPDQPGIVFLRDGSRREGVIIADEFDHVILEIQGIRTQLLRESVDYVQLQPTFAERYQQYKAALETWSAARHLELCRWLFSERRYDLARQELQDLLDRERYPPAVDLLRTVDAQLALTSLPRSNDDRPGGGVPDADHDPDADLPVQVLTRDDVNLIRAYEIDFDHPPRVTVTADTIRELLENYGSNELIPTGAAARTAMFRADPLDIVRLMFKLRARELYPRIEVSSEPYSLNLFRQRVHNTWLISRCASTDCHGGIDGGRFFLHRRGYREERVRYANLLLLERTKLDPDWPLINYRDPMLSLIIQHALPRAEARKPHPPVKGWEPVFNRGNRRLLDGTLEWIGSMIQPRPDYPIDYPPPDLAALRSKRAGSTPPPTLDDAPPRETGQNEDAPNR